MLNEPITSGLARLESPPAKPTQHHDIKTLAQALTSAKEVPRVYWGGPVAPKLISVITTLPTDDYTPIPNTDLHSHSMQSFSADTALPIDSGRVFLGFAGWGPGQLQAEIASGVWRVHTPKTGKLQQQLGLKPGEPARKFHNHAPKSGFDTVENTP